MVQPTCGIGKCHLPMLVLNELAHHVTSQINVQHPRHGLVSFPGAVAVSGGGNQLDFDAERLQHSEHFAELASGLAFLQIDDKPQAGAGGKRQLLLGHAHCFAGVSGQFADQFRIVFHGSYHNVTVR